MFFLSELRNDDNALPPALDPKACLALDEIFHLHVPSYMP
jgi:hypothetical protein